MVPNEISFKILNLLCLGKVDLFWNKGNNEIKNLQEHPDMLEVV